MALLCAGSSKLSRVPATQLGFCSVGCPGGSGTWTPACQATLSEAPCEDLVHKTPSSRLHHVGPNTAWLLQGELPRGSVTLNTSVSGNTVYMEPQPVVALNNAEALLAGEEQEEELAILADLSRQVSN